MSFADAEKTRLRYLYRKRVLDGKVMLSRKDAVKLVGPDCAYHLYHIVNYDRVESDKARNRKRDVEI